MPTTSAHAKKNILSNKMLDRSIDAEYGNEESGDGAGVPDGTQE